MQVLAQGVKLMDVQHILVVDDSQVIRHLVKYILVEAGYDVWTAVSGEEALEIISKKGLPHLAIVDINMPPGMDGFALCDKLHQFSDVPIIMLSAEEGEETVVTGLEYHAEDYIVKPSNGPLRAAELKARVKTVLNRMGDFAYTLDPIVIVDERLQVDFPGRCAFIAGEKIKLTPTETKLLYLLMRHGGRTITNEYLLRRVWPNEEAYEERLHTHIYRLRKKIEENHKDPQYVLSDWGKGYIFPPQQK
jgi:DNA-binding response OmpR family regulator